MKNNKLGYFILIYHALSFLICSILTILRSPLFIIVVIINAFLLIWLGRKSK